MDVEKLIEEQKKTRKILRQLEKAGTLDKFLASITPLEPTWEKDPFRQVDDWDYDGLEFYRGQIIAKAIMEASENLSLMKYAQGYIDNLYKGRITQWEQYRLKNPTKWKSFITNPECLQFFNDYEKAYNIKTSIAKESQNV